jgi:hypothetical protein
LDQWDLFEDQKQIVEEVLFIYPVPESRSIDVH